MSDKSDGGCGGDCTCAGVTVGYAQVTSEDGRLLEIEKKLDKILNILQYLVTEKKSQ